MKARRKRSIVRSRMILGGTADGGGTNVWIAILSLAKGMLGDISLRLTSNSLTLPKHDKLSKETRNLELS